MIVICIKCEKKFEVDSSLIPENGRLLQCNGCNHKWFFKRENINTLSPTASLKNDSNKDFLINNENPKEETKFQEIDSPETIKLLDVSKKLDFKEKIIKINDQTAVKKKYNKKNIINKKKNYNILSITIVFIISLLALIIIIDTFKSPISNIVPETEFLLYNLYESVKDIILFLKDLI